MMNSNVRGNVPSTAPQNSLHMTFKNASVPPNHINVDTVLDYFCNPTNVFFDPTSNNHTIKMQMRTINRPLDECLLGMTGIQYVVWSAQPPLFVICKQRRNSPQNFTPLAYYYVINGVVYQAPDVYSFAQSRLLGAVEPLKKAFDAMSQLVRYNVAKGYYWEFKDKEKNKAAEDDKEEEEKPLQARSTNFQKTRTQKLMQSLFDAFPAQGAFEVAPPGSPAASTAVTDVTEEQQPRP